MEAYSWWEYLLLGVMVLMVTFWMQAGSKAAFQRSKFSKPDWGAVILPLGLVVLFVIFLIAMV